MEVRAGREPGRADLTDHLARRHRFARHDLHLREVTVEQPYVLADGYGNVNACATRIKSRVSDSCRGRMHRGTRRRRQVDAGVDVEPRAKWIERLQGQGRAAEGEGLDRTWNDRRERQPLLARNLGRGERPHRDGGDDDRQNPQPRHHAWATACSTALKPVLNADSSLCAAFSAPPIAPGTLNTTSSAARAKRWWIGV